MTREEVGKLLAVIRAAYPGWQRGAEAQAAAVWLRYLADIDAADAARALDAHIKASRYAPTVAEIRAGAAKSKPARLRPAPVFLPPEAKRIGGGG